MTLEGEYEPSPAAFVRDQVAAYEAHNLRADPEAVMIQDGPEPFDARVREVSGSDRATWWERAVAVYPPYAEYQAGTDRVIPVLVASRRA